MNNKTRGTILCSIFWLVLIAAFASPPITFTHPRESSSTFTVQVDPSSVKSKKDYERVKREAQNRYEKRKETAWREEYEEVERKTWKEYLEAVEAEKAVFQKADPQIYARWAKCMGTTESFVRCAAESGSTSIQEAIAIEETNQAGIHYHERTEEAFSHQNRLSLQGAWRYEDIERRARAICEEEDQIALTAYNRLPK